MFPRPAYAVIAMMTLSVVLVGCGKPGTGAGSPALPPGSVGSGGAEVASVATIEVYSGRANPSWPLDPSARSAVAEIVDSLRVDPRAAPPDDGKLGFRWIEVSNLSTAHGHAARVVVAPRVVVLELSTDQRTLVLDDTESQALRALLHHATGSVNSGVLDIIRQEIH